MLFNIFIFFILICIFASRYKRPKAGFALVVRCSKNGDKVFREKGTFVFPVIQESYYIPTTPISVKIKDKSITTYIEDNDESILRAIKRFQLLESNAMNKELSKTLCDVSDLNNAEKILSEYGMKIIR